MPVVVRAPDDEYRILEFMDDVSNEVAISAVSVNGSNIKWIKNPSDDVITAAIRKTPKSILHVENPSMDHIIQSCCRAPSMFKKFIKEFDETAYVMLATKCDQPNWYYKCNEFMTFAPTHAKKIVFERSRNTGYVSDSIDQWSYAGQKRYIKDHPNMIKSITDPTDEIWQIAIENDPDMISYVDCPDHARYHACKVKPDLAPSNIDVVSKNANEYLIHLGGLRRRGILKILVDHEEFVTKANEHLLRGLCGYLKVKFPLKR